MKVFSGFPRGKLAYTSLPDLFFAELLPTVDDLAELKVTLHVLWLLFRRRVSREYVALHELLGDGGLLRGLDGLGASSDEALLGGLNRAVARGTLLCLQTTDKEKRFYFVNSAKGRSSYEQARMGDLQLLPGAALTDATVAGQRPNVFVLYEQNIGLLQPMIAEELKEAEQSYPAEWIEEAFRIAVENNVRNWKYVRRILERWAAEGKDSGKGSKGDKGWYEEYGGIIKR
jgi:DNA replication protein